jgi:hypothetical protein
MPNMMDLALVQGGDAQEPQADRRQEPLMYFGQTAATVRAHG